MYLKQAVALLLMLQVSFCKGVEKTDGGTERRPAIGKNDSKEKAKLFLADDMMDKDEVNHRMNFLQRLVMESAEDRKDTIRRLSDDLTDLQLKVDSRTGGSKQNPCKVVKKESKCLPQDCSGANESKVYTIRPRGTNAAFRVNCLKDESGDPWTVIQRRFDGSVDFKVDWNKYKIGFGSLDGEFWLGLDHIHTLTYSDRYEIRIKFKMLNDTIYVAYNDYFLVSDEESNYTLQGIGQHSGNASNAFQTANGQMWSTFDRDNDSFGVLNCALEFESGWWYNACSDGKLNAPFSYVYVKRLIGQGITWFPFRNKTIKATEMAIRKKKLS